MWGMDKIPIYKCEKCGKKYYEDHPDEKFMEEYGIEPIHWCEACSELMAE